MALMTRGDAENPPDWLVCKKSLIPDMVAKSPEKMPVWEITGAEFTKSDHHTADGISIRFPRITKQRDDKSFKEATNLQELNVLFEASKDCTNLHMLTDGLNDDGSEDTIEIKTKIQHKQVRSPAKAGESLKRKLKSTSDDDEPLNAKVKVKQQPVKVDTDGKFNLTDAYGKDIPSTSSADSKKAKNEAIDKKLKLTYDSSDDEKATAASSSSVVANSMPKMLATTKSNKDTLATSIKDVEIEEKLLLPPSTAASANDCDIENKSTIETADAGTIAKNSDINIFEGVLLYVPTVLRDCLKEELRYFVLWGGTESNSTKKSTHVLHKNDSLTGEWNKLR